MPLETQGYLREALEMVPEVEAHELLALRAAYLGHGPRKAPTTREERDRSAAALESAREVFWSTDPDELLAEIEELPLDAYPDLVRTRDKLARVARLRTEFERAEADRRVAREVLDGLCAVSIAPARRARALRARLLEDLSGRRGRRKLQKTLRRLRRRYPELYALEKSWFDTLRDWRRAHELAAHHSLIEQVSGFVALFFKVALGLFLIVVVVAGANLIYVALTGGAK